MAITRPSRPEYVTGFLVKVLGIFQVLRIEADLARKRAPTYRARSTFERRGKNLKCVEVFYPKGSGVDVARTLHGGEHRHALEFAGEMVAMQHFHHRVRVFPHCSVASRGRHLQSCKVSQSVSQSSQPVSQSSQSSQSVIQSVSSVLITLH